MKNLSLHHLFSLGFLLLAGGYGYSDGKDNKDTLVKFKGESRFTPGL